MARPLDDAGGLIPTYVMLGDGTRFAQQVGPDGVVQFTDPALQGPQDVTVVRIGLQTSWSPDGGLESKELEQLETHLGVAQPEVDFRPAAPYQPSDPLPVVGRVEGTISPCGDGRVNIHVAGEGIAPYTQWLGECGKYSFEVRGTKPGPLTVVANNTCFDYDICWPPLVTPRVGIVTGITFSESGIAQADIEMDNTYQDSVDLQVQNLPPASSDLRAGILYVTAGRRVFDVFGSPDSPLHVTVPTKGGPFDSLERWAWVAFHDSDNYVSTYAPLADPPVVRIPVAPEIREPAGATTEPWPQVERGALRIQWQCSSAGTAQIGFSHEDWFDWSVEGPCPDGSFSPFDLPGIVPAKYRPLPAGSYGVQLRAEERPTPVGS
ncbi:MAG: hypothetical protein QM765_12460 [Myxococcales bacterium]